MESAGTKALIDIGFWEVSLIAVLALIILGPERLPQVARTAGLWIGRARRVMADVKADINREINQEELRQIRNIGDDLKATRDDISRVGSDLATSIDQDAVSENSGTPSEAVTKPEKSAVVQDVKPE